VTASAALIAAGTFVVLRLSGLGDVAYLPFPTLSAPEFSIAAGAAIALLLAPLAGGRK
jgi:hypothetical protein